MQKEDTVDTVPLLEPAKPKRGGVKGIVYMLCAVFSFHLTRFFVKLCYFVSDISVWEVISIRALLVVILCAFTICIKDRSLFYIPRHLRWILFVRCFVGTLSFSLLFISLKYLTYSTSMILFFLYPIFTSIAGWFIMREKLSIYDIGALLVSLLGVIFFAFPQILGQQPIKDDEAPQAEVNTPEGLVMGFLQPIFMSLAIISIRKIGKRLHSLTTPFYFQLFAFVIYAGCLTVIGLVDGLKTKYTWQLMLYMLASGVLGYLGLVAMALALQNQKAGRIATLEYIQIVFGFVIDIFIFNADIGPSEILGSALITVSSLLITVLKCTDVIK